MGWAANDEPIKEEIKLELSALREATYKPLRQLGYGMHQLTHTEKKTALLDCINRIRVAMDDIEGHLSR